MAHDELRRNSFPSIRAKLLNFPGGHVSLVKDHNSGIAELILDHGEKRNAMSGQMMVEFRDCIEDLENWKEGKGLILRGAGCNFCSGGDLDFAKISTPQDGLDMSTWMQNALMRLQMLPLVSVCLVHGPCLGGGAEMSIFCDYIIVADDVKFGFVQGKMGIITAWGGGSRLVQRIGHSRALEVLLTSKIMNAEECLSIGLVELVTPSPVDVSKVRDWLKTRLFLPHQITRSFKTIASNTHLYNYGDALKLEREIFAPFWGGTINKEAISRNIKHSK
ncbi:hypothetical protein RI129_012235 [Pyrocoelia pectoralis]|uniref:Enoyl-CoA hydratase n=1 Tax=Pyrocoelia pectoralis TaxID=417401 RepID=A0AAN7Z5M9_9COLE